MPICLTCKQPIREGEQFDTFRDEAFHEDPSDCVAATARRCMEITGNRKISWNEARRLIIKEFNLRGVE